MGSVVTAQRHGIARLRRLPGLACALACAAAGATAAGPEPPRPSAPAPSGHVLKLEESPSSRVLYFEEGGGIISPIAKPPAGSARPPMRALPGREARVPAPRPPVARVAPAAPGAGKAATRLARPVPAPAPAPAAAVPPAPVAKTDAEIRLEKRRDYEALVARIAGEASPPADRARRLDTAAGDLVVAYRDAGAALRIGWLWLEGKDAASAALWFGRARTWDAGNEEALRGLAIANLAERNYAAALARAGELAPGSPTRNDVSREAWIGIGQGEYGLSRYGSAIEAFDRAGAFGALPRHARMLRAWSRLKAGEPDVAASDFAALYRESPDLESAQGVVAAVPSGALPVDAVVAATEPLATLLREREGEAAFRSRRYLEARALDPRRWGSLGSPGTLAALSALARREKTGDPGLLQLVARARPAADVVVPLGDRAALTLSSDEFGLDAGRRDPGVLVGSAPTAAIVDATGALRETVRETRVGLRYERGFAFAASVGPGVEGGAVGARAVGGVEAAAVPAWGQAEARAFVEPVRESVLAWAGMADPQGGPSWGGVRRIGAEARALYLARAPWSAGAHVRVERLVGTLVARNVRRAVDASLGRDLGLPGFAYASLGLAAGADSYGRNLSHFTTGHGGYFSPQSYRKLGAAFDFMTAEGQRFLVQGRASAARNWKREDAAPWFPLAPDGRDYPGIESKGHEASLRIAAVAQVSPHVQVGLAFGRSTSPQWGETLALLQLRITFEPRHGVVSADLPAPRGE